MQCREFNATRAWLGTSYGPIGPPPLRVTCCWQLQGVSRAFTHCIICCYVLSLLVVAVLMPQHVPSTLHD
jgi:hypothetical protein